MARETTTATAPTTERETARLRRSGPSLRPALLVVGLAIFIIVGGAALALVGTSSAHPTSSGPARKVAGSKLEAQSAAGFLSHIASGGEPPRDVLDALAVPAGSRYLGREVESRGVSQFDSSVRLACPDPEASVRNFYLRLLSEQHWVTSSITSPSRGSSELIAERSGSDGYEWRVGIILHPVSTVVSPALGGGGASASRTTASIELYQVADAS